MIRFLLNGQVEKLETVDSRQTLAQYLRAKHLTGTKIACEQGGCGACTVIVSDWQQDGWQHRSVNSCLYPVASLEGKAVTTIEALGSVKTGLHPIQHQMAVYGASQCGFCSSGFIMRMLELRNKALSMDEVETGFDGNICRCTGYRPILQAFRTMADDYEVGESQIIGEALPHEAVTIHDKNPLPSGEGLVKQRLNLEGWHRPLALAELYQLIEIYPGAGFLVGNSGAAFETVRENTLIDISEVLELRQIQLNGDCLEIGGAVRIQELIDYPACPELLRKSLGRLGNQQIRNVASLAGNLMMSLQRAKNGGIPIVSDVYTPLLALDARIKIYLDGKESLCDLANIPDRALILSIEIALPVEGEISEVYRIARRPQNSRAIVNAAFRITLDEAQCIREAIIVFGGLERLPERYPAIEKQLIGQVWSKFAPLDLTLKVAYESDEGISASFRLDSAKALIEKFLGQKPELNYSLSSARQTFAASSDVLGKSLLKSGVFLQSTGEALYTHDLPLPPRGLHAAYITSEKAHAHYQFSVDEVLGKLKGNFPSLVDIVSARDIQGKRLIGLGYDDPVFVDGIVSSYGQPIALVLAEDEASARAAAKAAQAFIHYEELPYQDFEAGIAAKDFFADNAVFQSIKHLKRDEALQEESEKNISGQQRTGLQAHFYMETQAVLVVPDEQKLVVYASTQDVYSIQWRLAEVLKRPFAEIEVNTRRIGGGFGAKETRPPLFAAAAAVAAEKHHRPVRLVLDRATDTRMVGKRHAFRGDYRAKLGADSILEQETMIYADGGDSYDVSLLILDLAMLTYDHAYYIPRYSVKSEAVRSHKASNTAMRSFGMIQAHLIQENIWEHAAHELKIRPDKLRRKQLYRSGDKTPYGETLVDSLLVETWDRLVEEADFEERWNAIEAFNQEDSHFKRGISLLPLRYGVGYTAPFLNQATALVNVYAGDASVQVWHGGVEMGQGIHIKMLQIAASTLNIPIEKIRVGDMKSSVIPNATSTGASAGTDLNGSAVYKACLKLVKRLEKFAEKLRRNYGEEACEGMGIAYWKHPQGWAGYVGERLIWDNLILQAYFHRLNLSSQAAFKYPKLKNVLKEEGTPFFYYNYAAAISEVEIDSLTGEFILRRTDILYDAAQSINPIIDIGQIEGGFVQGLGYVTMEDVLFDNEGRLLSDNFWTYKVPCTRSIPQDFRVSLYQHGRHIRSGAAQPNLGVKSSKSTGEPPLVLANTVFFALRHAISAARAAKGWHHWFQLDAPATIERIQQACQHD